MKAAKKVISVLLSFVLVTTAFTALPFSVYSAVAEESVGAKTDILFGDVNGDGTIDFINDVIMVNNYINGDIDFSEEQKILADANGDNNIDNDDVLLLNSVRQSGDYYSLPIYDKIIDADYFGSVWETSVKYILKKDKTLVIFGTGKMKDYSDVVVNHRSPWYGSTEFTTLDIREGVTSIGSAVFCHCSKLKTVKIPDSVTSIGEAAFADTGLKNVTLSSNVTSIASRAFGYYNAYIALSDFVIFGHIDSDAERYAKENGMIFGSLEHETLSGPTGDCNWTLDKSGILTINGKGDMGDYVNFSPWSNGNWTYENVTQVIINKGVTSIGKNAFCGCTSLVSVTIPDSITSFGDYAFVGCHSLKTLTIPVSVVTIGNYTFNNTNVVIDYLGGELSWCSISKGSNAVPSHITVNFAVDDLSPEVSFNSTNELAAMQVVSIDMYDNIGIAGYYWGTNSNYSNNSYTSTSNTNVSETVVAPGTYYATAVDTSDNVSSTVSITFYKTTLNPNANDASVSPTSVLTKSGNSFTFPTPTPASSNYSYVGWSTSSSATSGVKTLSPSSNTTYYAVWQTSTVSITDCTITLSPTSYTFDGTAKQPSVTVKYGSTTLTRDIDYTVSYSNNTNAGTATVTITGKGGYTGSITKSFIINPKSISSATVTLSPTSYTYDGTEKKPSVTVKDGTKTLTSGTDYSVSYSNNVDVGTATVTVTGKNNYTGSTSKTFTITEPEKINISNCTIILSPTSFTYDGTAKQPNVTVKYSSTTLTKDTDYTVSYSNNTDAGTATVTITGKGGYTGSTTKNFTINPKSIVSATVTLSPTFYTYDGTEKKPSVTVKDGTKTLTSGTDYSVSYSNNVNVGTATVTVNGKDNYTDSKTLEFIIRNNEGVDDKNRLRGDTDGDGIISISDVTIIQQYLAEYSVTSKFTVASADSNEDGVITIVDATCIQQYLAEYTISERIGYPISDIEQVTTRLPATEPTTTTPVISEPPTEPTTDQVIEYDNGDYVYVPSEDNLEFDTEEAALYYNNSLSVYLLENITKNEEQHLANLCDGEVSGRIKGDINVLQIKVTPTNLDALNNYSNILMNEDNVLYATYDFPIDIESNSATEPPTTRSPTTQPPTTRPPTTQPLTTQPPTTRPPTTQPPTTRPPTTQTPTDTPTESSKDNNPWSYNGVEESDKGNESTPNGNDWWAEAIGAYRAWKYTDYTQKDAGAGIIDNGFDINHNDFINNGKTKIAVIGNNTPHDHGTHVAGIIAANNNDEGIRGIADSSELVCASMDISDVTVSPRYCEHIKYMIDAGITCINLSWGNHLMDKEEFEKVTYAINYLSNNNSYEDIEDIVDNYNPSFWESVKHGINLKIWDYCMKKGNGYETYVKSQKLFNKKTACVAMALITGIEKSNKDVLVVQSAGNGYSYYFPKNETEDVSIDATNSGFFCAISQSYYDELNQSNNKLQNIITYNELKSHIIIVGAVENTQLDGRYKVTGFSNYGDTVDIVAPGKDILSTVTTTDDNISKPDKNDGKNYGKLDGTSMSAPMVTGSATLLKSLDPTLSSSEIKSILINTSTQAVGVREDDAGKIHSMLNVGNAVEYVMSHRLHKRLVDDKPFMQKMVEMHFEGESISSAAELQQKISDNPYGTFYLTNDIEGDDETNNFRYTIPEFHGTLYGNGYTIKELSVIGGEAALFRNIEDAEIRDLGFDSVAATALFANGTYAGIIAAFADSCVIENCYAVNCMVNSTYMAGSFTAYANNTKFINLYSNTAVSGLCGMGSNTDTDYVSGSIGGITGYYENRQPNSDSFVNCRVESVITAEVSSDNYIKSGNVCVGGIVGNLNATTGSPQRPMDSSDENLPPTPITFSKCQFNGEVRGYGGNTWYSEEISSGKTLYHTADVYSGGLIGNAKTDWGSGTGAWSGIVHVIDSSVTGTVIADTKGTACAGGVIGYTQVFTESGYGVLIKNTSFNGRVNAYYQEDDKCDIAYIGTMIGSNNFHCLLDSSKSSGTINAKSDWAIYAGKLIGDDINSQTNISNATVNVTMNIDSDATDSWRHIGGNIGSV